MRRTIWWNSCEAWVLDIRESSQRAAHSRAVWGTYCAACAVLGLGLLLWMLSAPGASPGGLYPRGESGHEGGGAASGEGGDSEEGDDQQRPAGEEALSANPLYETERLAPRPCPVPQVDVESPDSMNDFLNEVSDCLDEAWATQFRRAGLPFEPPERVFWTEPGTSPCRDYPSAAGAFYCRSSASIYIGTEDVVRKWNGETNAVVYASLLAHEYGHHVQGESGILEYYHDQRGEEDELADRNAWTRRGELQANCLAGVFLGAVMVSYPLSESDRSVLMDDAEATADREGNEDERTHGSPENSVMWTEAGMADQRPGACNTWDAPVSDVA